MNTGWWALLIFGSLTALSLLVGWRCHTPKRDDNIWGAL